jgi:outer membrane protein TolC
MPFKSMIIPNWGGKDFNFPLIFISLWISLVLLMPFGSLQAGEKEIPLNNRDAPKSAPITLTVGQSVDLALLNNRNITSSRFRAESQHYSVTAAKADFDVKIVPGVNTNFLMGNKNVGAGVAIKKKLETGATVSLNPSVNVTNQQYWNDVSLTIEQPLFKGFGEDVNLDIVRSAEFSKQTAVRNIYQTKVNIGLEMITTFYNAVKQREINNSYNVMASRLKGHAAVAMAKGKVGLATPMETYRAEIRLKEAEDSATQASEAYLDAQDRIKVILSLPLKTEIALVTPAPPDYITAELSTAIDTALKNRIEIEQARAEIQEAERRSLVMRQNTLPGVNLVMSVGQYAMADTFGQAATLSQNRWNVALQGSTDLQRAAEKAAYQQSLLNVKMLRLDLENRMEEIDKQVRKQWNAFKEDEKRIRIRKEQMQQAREKLALAEVKYAHGMADNFDVIEAETELQRAKVMLLTAEMDYAAGTYNMKAILGTLIPKN